MDNSAAAAEPAADFPEDFNFEGNLIELTPENELNFIESKASFIMRTLSKIIVFVFL